MPQLGPEPPVTLGRCMQYIEQHLSVALCGPTGTGKTFVSCALGEQACPQGYRALEARWCAPMEPTPVCWRHLRNDLLIFED